MDQAPQPSDERSMRRAKRQALIDSGIDPYPIASTVTAFVADLKETYKDLEDGGIAEDGVTYHLCGRIRAIRGHGKLMFFDLADKSGQIQLFMRVNNLDEATWALASDLDVGDIIEAAGTVIRTKRGELSLSVTGIKLLTKSLRPLPEKFHGLSDREVRYRQRYVDLIMNPEVKDTFVKRSQIISAIRHFMEGQGYIEVETPILQETLGGANARPFTTHFNVLDQDCYLRIATELHLKRCLVGGLERVFEIGRQFRNEGMDLTHNPEFTSMEAYCAYSDLAGMKELSEGLFQACAAAIGKGDTLEYQGTTIDISSPWRSVPMHEIVSEVVGEEVTIDTPVEHLREILEKNELEWDASWGAGKLIFELYDELCEKTITDPTFVCDYPVEVSPLAKRKADDPRLTDRFELVVCGKEYANAFSELNDPVDQEGRFAAQVAAKAAGDDEAMDYDYDYVRALEYGMPPAGGIGYGIDRIIMLFCDQPSIRDVLLFPHLRPERREGRPEVQKAEKEEAPAAEKAEAPVAEPVEAASAPEVAKDAAGQDDSRFIMDGTDMSGKLEAGLTRDEAWDLLTKYNEDEFHLKHGETLEGLMRYFAETYDPENVDFWGIVGLLHDLDWEKWQASDTHTVKAAELILAAGGTEQLVHAIQTHNSDNREGLPAPTLKMECALWASDELSGLIQAAILMRPSKSVMDLNVKSLRKKYKDKRFAAGCDRDIIARGAELMGWDLTQLFDEMIKAMQAIAPDRDTFGQA